MLNSPDYIGEGQFEDESKPDEVTKSVAGDVIFIDQGSRVTLSSPNKAKCKYKTI